MDNRNSIKEFVKLIQENKGILFKICNSYCHKSEEREDLTQEIIYQLWRSGKTFHADQKFSTWMYRVALNVAISFYRKSKSANALVSFTENLKDIEDNEVENVAFENEYEKSRKLLQKSINELKELDRALIILFLEAKNYKEIAEILGITETNVATKISRIKDKLKQKILIINY
jgi:RNA polymerase sigma-70 factor (ECF subfamily)